MFFFRYLFLKFQKNKSRKLSMLEQKQRQICNLHEIPHKVLKPNFNFRLIILSIEDLLTEIYFFQKY